MPMKSKYWYYERSVQSPEAHAYWFRGIFREVRQGRDPHHLREDFCGTFAMSCSWVKLGLEYTAYAVDLDSEPLAYGRKEHLSKLSADQRRRLSVARQDVRKVKAPRADLVAACNFSFFGFKSRLELLQYFRSAYRGLRRGGAFILEMAGGPGMIHPVRESKPVYTNGRRRFTYVWSQFEFDPIRNEGRYAIDFLLPRRKKIEKAFTYDWRLWSVPEVRELIAEAGFDSSRVYWEISKDGKGTGEFTFAESAENAYSWLAYVVGLKD